MKRDMWQNIKRDMWQNMKRDMWQNMNEKWMAWLYPAVASSAVCANGSYKTYLLGISSIFSMITNALVKLKKKPTGIHKKCKDHALLLPCSLCMWLDQKRSFQLFQKD